MRSLGRATDQVKLLLGLDLVLDLGQLGIHAADDCILVVALRLERRVLHPHKQGRQVKPSCQRLQLVMSGVFILPPDEGVGTSP